MACRAASQPSILDNSRQRYLKDEIYTFAGKILVALNPCKAISGMYGPDAMSKYVGCNLTQVLLLHSRGPERTCAGRGHALW